MSPIRGRPNNAILSRSVRSSGAFDSASVIALANSSSAPEFMILFVFGIVFILANTKYTQKDRRIKTKTKQIHRLDVF